MQQQGVDTQQFSFGFPEIFRRECDLRGTPGIRWSLRTPGPPVRLLSFTIRSYRGFHSARMSSLIPRVIGPHADANAGITFRFRCRAESRTIRFMDTLLRIHVMWGALELYLQLSLTCVP